MLLATQFPDSSELAFPTWDIPAVTWKGPVWQGWTIFCWECFRPWAQGLKNCLVWSVTIWGIQAENSNIQPTNRKHSRDVSASRTFDVREERIAEVTPNYKEMKYRTLPEVIIIENKNWNGPEEKPLQQVTCTHVCQELTFSHNNRRTSYHRGKTITSHGALVENNQPDT